MKRSCESPPRDVWWGCHGREVEGWSVSPPPPPGSSVDQSTMQPLQADHFVEDVSLLSHICSPLQHSKLIQETATLLTHSHY